MKNWEKNVKSHSVNISAREEREKYSDTEGDTALLPVEDTTTEQIFSYILWNILHWKEFFPPEHRNEHFTSTVYLNPSLGREAEDEVS